MHLRTKTILHFCTAFGLLLIAIWFIVNTMLIPLRGGQSMSAITGRVHKIAKDYLNVEGNDTSVFWCEDFYEASSDKETLKFDDFFSKHCLDQFGRPILVSVKTSDIEREVTVRILGEDPEHTSDDFTETWLYRVEDGNLLEIEMSKYFGPKNAAFGFKYNVQNGRKQVIDNGAPKSAMRARHY
jgi:hypothetical protein